MVKEKELRKWLYKAERVVIAGIGNPIRMDDSAGVRIVRNLRGKVPKNVCLIECETVPENFTQQIINLDPTHIMLIDVAVLGKKSGASFLVEPEDLASFPAILTHILPLRIFCGVLAEGTRAKIALLLIEPERIDFGENLTPIMEASVGRVVNLLIRVNM